MLISAPCLVTTEALNDRKADMAQGRKHKHTRGFIRLAEEGGASWIRHD